jgi:hypothetical protein
VLDDKPFLRKEVKVFLRVRGQGVLRVRIIKYIIVELIKGY